MTKHELNVGWSGVGPAHAFMITQPLASLTMTQPLSHHPLTTRGGRL
jgi:hypothetical protein